MKYLLKKAYIETQNDEKFDSRRLEQLFFDDYPAQDAAEVVAVFDSLKKAKREFGYFDISAKDMGRFTLRAVKFIEEVEDDDNDGEGFEGYWDVEVARTPAEELAELDESNDCYDDIHEIEFSD